MPYGPEVSQDELDGNGTIDDRGLQLICYQSSIVRGFKFIQQGIWAWSSILELYSDSRWNFLSVGWYNNVDFPPNKPTQPGYDPIFGQTGMEQEGQDRFMSGANPSLESQLMSFPHKFIDVRGGEYFFSPSISTLRDIIGAK